MRISDWSSDVCSSDLHNHIFTWEIGDQDGTDQAFDRADVTVKELISYQRVHPSPMETCACIGSMDKIKGELTVYGTFQAPHVVRTVTRSEEHTSELQSLMRISYAVFCLKKKKKILIITINTQRNNKHKKTSSIANKT